MKITTPDDHVRLAAADTRRDGPESERIRAATTYAELAETIDPSTPEGAARVEWILERGVAPPAAFEVLIRRAAQVAADVHLRRIAEGALHSFDVARGDVHGAERRLKDLLLEFTAERAPEACAVAANLADVFLSQGREFEVLVVGRRAALLAREHHAAGVLGIALSKVTWALMQLDDWRAAAATAAEIETIVPDLAEAHVPHALRLVHRVRARHALAAGRIGAARAETDAFRALDAVSEPTPSDRVHLAELAALTALASSRPHEAAAHAARMTAAPGCSRTTRLRAGAVSVRALVAAGETARARETAESLRDALLAGVRDGTHVAVSLRATAEIAHRLAPDPGALGFVEIASEALFARIAQLESCVVSLAGLTDEPAEDRTRLAEYRAKFVDEHRGLLSLVARLHERSGAPPPSILSSFSGDGRLRVCAWCLSVQSDDGRVLPVGHLVPRIAGLVISHGICDGCESRLRA